MTETEVSPGGAFHHEALFYSGFDELIAQCALFAREGLEAGDRMLVMMTGDKNRALAAQLNGAASGVDYADMAEVGRNPGRIISAWHDFATDPASVGRCLRGIGEPIWVGRSGDEIEECQRHEQLINLAFAGADSFVLLCPYDMTGLDSELIDGALRSHPSIRVKGHTKPSGAYRETDDERFTPLPPPPVTAPELGFAADALPATRRRVEAFAEGAGLSQTRIDDLVLAVNEVAANSVHHGGGVGTLRLWDDSHHVIAEIRDRGHIDAPLAGRLRPCDHSGGGNGLWLTHQVCDLVQVRSRPSGTAVRLHISLS